MARRRKTLWLALLTTVMLVGLGYYLTRPRIDPRSVGRWSSDADERRLFLVELNSDGRGIVSGLRIRWHVKAIGNTYRLRYVVDDRDIKFDFKPDFQNRVREFIETFGQDHFNIDLIFLTIEENKPTLFNAMDPEDVWTLNRIGTESQK